MQGLASLLIPVFLYVSVLVIPAICCVVTTAKVIVQEAATVEYDAALDTEAPAHAKRAVKMYVRRVR